VSDVRQALLPDDCSRLESKERRRSRLAGTSCPADIRRSLPLSGLCSLKLRWSERSADVDVAAAKMHGEAGEKLTIHRTLSLWKLPVSR
jgi:hypothetical protein